jgi:penicillin-binding protein 2
VSVAVQGRQVENKNIYRFGVFFLAVAVGVTALTARMFQMQVLEHKPAAQGAEAQANETVYIPSTRGLIYDSTGAPLVRNIQTFTVTVTPSDLPLDRELDVATKLGRVMGADPIDIMTRIDSATGSLYRPVTIGENVAVDVARFIEENYDQLPGVKVVPISKRQYLTKELFAELIGYEGRITDAQYKDSKDKPGRYSNQDVVGQAGLEAYYEETLRGVYASQQVALDDSGKPIPGLASPAEGEVPGSSLTLNISTREQQMALEALNWGLSNASRAQGTIIVMNPQNGKILAMVSLPSYNNQLFAEGISETDFQKLLNNKDEPLLNKATAQYPPGSTFKLVTATAALEEKVDGRPQYVATDELPTAAFLQVGEYRFTDWNNAGFGLLNLTEGFAFSSDTFFYKLSELLAPPTGKDRTNIAANNLAKWARYYGFGAATGVDLPGEAEGIVLDQEWKLKTTGKDVYVGELYQAAIGQGYQAATPLQLLNAYCALANGGNLWRPQLVGKITKPDGTVTDVAPSLIRRLPASEQTLLTMRLAARAVVTTGHTLNLNELPIRVAGKTGTAEFGVPDKQKRLPYHEWFVGFVPGDPYNGDFTQPDSQLAIVAFVNGANSRGNVAVEIVKYYLMRHFKLKYDLRARYDRTPGALNWWVTLRGNFYGRD